MSIYYLNTTRGQEAAVRNDLKTMGVYPTLPMRLCQTRKGPQLHWYDKPYISKVMFCNVPAIYWPDVNKHKHVIGKPIELTRADVRDLERFLEQVRAEYADMERKKANHEYVCQFAPGQALEMTVGVFEGFPATFRRAVMDARKDYHKLRVDMEIFGTIRSVDVDPDHVQEVVCRLLHTSLGWGKNKNNTRSALIPATFGSGRSAKRLAHNATAPRAGQVHKLFWELRRSKPRKHPLHDLHSNRVGRSRCIVLRRHFPSPDCRRVCIDNCAKLGLGKAQRLPGLLEVFRCHHRNSFTIATTASVAVDATIAGYHWFSRLIFAVSATSFAISARALSSARACSSRVISGLLTWRASLPFR